MSTGKKRSTLTVNKSTYIGKIQDDEPSDMCVHAQRKKEREREKGIRRGT